MNQERTGGERGTDCDAMSQLTFMPYMFGFAGAKRKGQPTCCLEGEKTCMKGDWVGLELDFEAKSHLNRRLGVRSQLGAAVHVFVGRRDRGQVCQSHLKGVRSEKTFSGLPRFSRILRRTKSGQQESYRSCLSVTSTGKVEDAALSRVNSLQVQSVRLDVRMQVIVVKHMG